MIVKTVTTVTLTILMRRLGNVLSVSFLGFLFVCLLQVLIQFWFIVVGLGLISVKFINNGWIIHPIQVNCASKL